MMAAAFSGSDGKNKQLCSSTQQVRNKHTNLAVADRCCQHV